MNRPGYNPTRRNRNIGTENAGYGQNNRLVIPTGAWDDCRRFYEKLVSPVEVAINVQSVSLSVLVEPTSAGCAHACTVDDIIRLLELIPASHVEGIRLIVLRQPKRKERLLEPVWGRWVLWSDIGHRSGMAIYLDAQEVGKTLRWDRSQSPDIAREFERLCQDGHVVTSDKRRYFITSSLDSVRRTQLHRTLPHEIGHFVDYQQRVVKPSADDVDRWISLSEQFWSRPLQEKEAFAHRYADDFRNRMASEGRLPFERVVDTNRIEEYGLDPTWFGL